MLERDIERQMCRAFRAKGCLCIKMETPTVGLPDRLIVRPDGNVMWVELKTDTGRLSEIQKVMIEKLRKLGQDVRVTHGLSEALALVEEVPDADL